MSFNVSLNERQGADAVALTLFFHLYNQCLSNCYIVLGPGVDTRAIEIKDTVPGVEMHRPAERAGKLIIN